MGERDMIGGLVILPSTRADDKVNTGIAMYYYKQLIVNNIRPGVAP